jgi:hypothetical protein
MSAVKRHCVLSLAVASLMGVPAVFAAERVDEKQYAPRPAPSAPAPRETVPGAVVPPSERGGIAAPPSVAPDIVIPVPRMPEPPRVTIIPAVPRIPALPQEPPTAQPPAADDDSQKERPLKEPEGGTVVIAPEEESRKPEEAASSEEPEKKLLTPGDFLPLTPGKRPSGGERADPVRQKAPPAPDEKRQEEAPKEAQGKGSPLRIPPDAGTTGKLDFLEGCWVGTRPEYTSKRIVKERFCFDKNGVGKRFIYDPAYAGECVGATNALIKSDGILRMRSSQMVCTSGDTWGASEMTCRGEGDQTPCTWVFSDMRNAGQSYKIRFVRE